MELLSMAQVVDQSEFCNRCKLFVDNEKDCYEICNSYLDNKPRKRKEVKEDE
jgi:hypothetical protein